MYCNGEMLAFDLCPAVSFWIEIETHISRETEIENSQEVRATGLLCSKAKT